MCKVPSTVLDTSFIAIQQMVFIKCQPAWLQANTQKTNCSVIANKTWGQ